MMEKNQRDSEVIMNVTLYIEEKRKEGKSFAWLALELGRQGLQHELTEYLLQESRRTIDSHS